MITKKYDLSIWGGGAVIEAINIHSPTFLHMYLANLGTTANQACHA